MKGALELPWLKWMLLEAQSVTGTESDDVVDRVQLKMEKSKIYRNLDILDAREQEVYIIRKFNCIV